MPRRDDRFQALLAALRRQVETCIGDGERLPTERQLAALHGVGSTTIHRALQTVATEGAITATAGVGWTKSRRHVRNGSPKSKPDFSVGLMTRRSADEWDSIEIYQALLSEARRRNIQIVPVPNPHRFRGVAGRNRIELTHVPWNTFDVGLLVEAEETIRTAYPSLLRRKVLAIDHDACALGIDSVVFPDHEIGAAAARHLLELGHIRFAVTDDFSSPGVAAEPSSLARRHGFETAIGAAGGLLMPEWRVPVPRAGSAQEHGNWVKRTLAAWTRLPAHQRPTALFAIDPSPLVIGDLFGHLSAAGWSVPRNLSIVVVTWDGTFWQGRPATVDGVRLTRVDLSLSSLARRTFDAAQQIAVEELPKKGKRPPHSFFASMTLLPGESTSSPC